MIRLLTLLTAFACTAFAAEPIAWGSPVDGVRFGVTLDLQASSQQLILVLENNGTTSRNARVGGRIGTGDLHFVELFAIAPDGSESILRNMNEPGVIAGVVEPIVFQLAPGRQESIVLRLDMILDDHWKESFAQLAQRRFGLRAVFKLTSVGPPMPNVALWSAELTSGVTRRGP
jgi:hypothetical protein